jgi:hypothetical protein
MRTEPTRPTIYSLALARGLRLRPADGSDLALMRAIALCSFSGGPAWRTDEYNLRHLSPEYDLESCWGVVHRRVAVNRDGKMSGYACYQLRSDGDVYLMDLAAIPPSSDARVRGCGACLLAAALEHALGACMPGLATVNVVRPVDGTVPVSRDPAGFYEKFGYRADPGARGYRSTGTTRSPGDLWMTSSLGAAFGRAVAYLAPFGTSRLPSSRPMREANQGS